MPQELSFGAILETVVTTLDPAQPALVHGDTRRSWGEVAQRSASLAAAMLAGGAVAGDRCALLMRNSAEYAEAMIACLRARLVHVNVNYRYTGEELWYILDNSDAAVCVYDAEFAPLVDSIRSRLPTKVWIQLGGDTPAFAQDFEATARDVGSGSAVGSDEPRRGASSDP
jgi:fatty-acyl-CoA synthase